MKIITFIILFILLYGPKFGLIDSRLFLLVLIPFVKSTVPRIGLRYFRILVFFMLYSLFISFINDVLSISSFSILRSGLSILLITYFFNNKKIFKSAYYLFPYVISIHSIIIILMFLYPSVQPLFHEVYNYNKSLKALRYTGLTAGFDIAGLISIISFVIWINKTLIKSTIINYFFLIITGVSCFLTSRTTIILTFMLLIFYSIFILTKTKMKFCKKYFYVFILVFLAYFGVIFFYDILVLSISEFEGGGSANAYVESGYNKTSAVTMLENFIYFPKTIFGIIFGIGLTPPVDSGYIRVINQVGVLGLMITLIFYINLFFKYKKKYHVGLIRLGNENYLRNIMTILFVLIILLNVKNEYFFTRSVTEIFFIIYFFAYLGSFVKIKTKYA